MSQHALRRPEGAGGAANVEIRARPADDARQRRRCPGPAHCLVPRPPCRRCSIGVIGSRVAAGRHGPHWSLAATILTATTMRSKTSQHKNSANTQPTAVILPPNNDRRNCQRHRSSSSRARSRLGLWIGSAALFRRRASNLTFCRRIANRGSSRGLLSGSSRIGSVTRASRPSALTLFHAALRCARHPTTWSSGHRGNHGEGGRLTFLKLPYWRSA